MLRLARGRNNKGKSKRNLDKMTIVYYIILGVSQNIIRNFMPFEKSKMMSDDRYHLCEVTRGQPEIMSLLRTTPTPCK